MISCRKLISVFLIILVAGTLTPFSASADTRKVAWGAANSAGDGVRIRSGAGLGHDVLNHANRGDPIVIIERTSSDWYRVNFDGTVGYVSASLLERPRTVADFNANGKVVGSDVNMREKPNTGSRSLGTFARDTIMSIIGLNEGWYKVRFGDKTGYIRSDLMEVVSSAGGSSPSASASQITGRVTGSKVNMREKADISSAILGTYASGTVMNVQGVENGWYKVQYDSKTGYVSSDYMQVSSAPPAIDRPNGGSDAAANASTYVVPAGKAPSHNAALSAQIVDYALGFIGSRYVSGGASPSGFDCSGFTYYIYRQFGINLTRNASGQYRDNGTHIDKSEVAPGDLIFTSSNGRNVTHVGIYIGDSKMVHASTSTTGVIISSLANKDVFGYKRVA